MSLKNTIKFIINHPLNRDDKFKSLIRFLKWQIGSRIVSGSIVFNWVNDSKLLVKTGETGLTGNIYTGLHEFSDMGFLLHVLRNTDLFIDVGANVGSYTILACAAIGARGVAFEPVPGTYDRLIENIKLNHLEKKVNCVNKGVSNQKGSISFTSDRDTTNHALALGEKYNNAITVEVTTLDSELDKDSPSLLKIDVEGYETLVLEGAQKTLKKKTLKAVIMELNGSGNRYGFNESKIIEMMYDYGFKAYSYNPLYRNLINLKWKNIESGNTLFIRDKEIVTERLKNAQKVSILGKQF